MILRFALLILLGTVFGDQTSSFAKQRLQYKILEAADQRDAAAAVFERALAGNNQLDHRDALLGLGRIGGETETLKISPLLYSRQPDIRAMAAFT